MGSSARWRAALAATAGLLVAVAVQYTAPASADTGQNPVVVENQQPGTDAWRILLTPADDTAQQIKGYADAVSVNIGGTIGMHVTVHPAQQFSIDIYRIGYYQGLGGRLMQHVGPMDGVAQPPCAITAATGTVSCAWSTSYSLTVPATWTSGIYLAKLTNAQNFQSYIVFTVRDDNRPSALLYQQSVTTYEAYNNFPNDVPAGGTLPATGKSLYDYNSSSTQTSYGTARAVQVSFDRPYANDDGAGDFLDWELYMVRWIEQNGYDVSYSTDIDTDLAGSLLTSHHAFLSVGHDEYWSKQMVDNVTAARDAGVGLGFFGANAVYWQIRLGPNDAGAPDRVITCFKSAALDPVQGATTTVNFRSAPVNRPEQALLGAMSTGQQPTQWSPAPYVVTNSGNWVYAGTGLHDGDSIAHIAGYETDRQVSGVVQPVAVPGTYTLLSNSPYTTATGGSDTQQAAVYQSASGAWVFDAGSIEWSWGLYSDAIHSYADPRIQQVTANVLNVLAAGVTQPPPTAPSNLAATPASQGSVQLTWTASTDPNAQYVVQTSDNAAFANASSTTLPAGQTSYTATGLPSGASYFRVQATDTGGSSPYSNTAQAATVAYSALVGSSAGLLSYWRLGDSSGSVATDATGRANGTYLGAVTRGAPGAIARDPDTAIGFDGATAKVQLPPTPTVTDFTLEAWTCLPAGWAGANSTVYGSNGTVRLLARPGGSASPTEVYAGVWLNGTEYTLQPSATTDNTGTCVLWDVVRAGGTLAVYRNGVSLAQRTDLPATATANINGWIGAQTGSAYYAVGRIDDVSLYSTALSAAQVQTHWVAGTNGPTVPSAPSGLAATPLSGSSVGLSWTASTDSGAQYVLQRSSTGDFTDAVTTTLSSQPSTTVTGLAAGVYYFRVLSTDNGLSSSYSNVSSAATQSYLSAVTATSSLISYWRLGDPSAVQAVDQTGTANGTYLGAVTAGAPGAITRDPDTAVAFDGATAKVQLPSVAPVTDFTLQAWTCLPAGWTGANSAVYGSNGTVRLMARPGGTASATAVYAGLWLGGTEYTLQPTAGASNTGSCVQWVLTRAGSTLSIYRNGVLLAQRGDLPASTTADISGWIGAISGSAYYAVGRIDDVAIYRSALSAATVSADYVTAGNGLAPPPPPPPPSYLAAVTATPGLASYWRLGDASGNVAVDATGRANGTYAGAVGLGAPGAITNDPNTSVAFDGQTAKVSLPAAPSVTSFSLEAWTCLPAGWTGANSAVYGSNGTMRLLARPGGTASATEVYVGLWLGGTEYTLQPKASVANAGVCVQWVVVRAGGTLSLYRNGALLAQRTDLPASAPAAIDGWIGAVGGTAYYAVGRIDDISIYTSALSPAQVSAHYTAAMSGPSP